MQTESNLHEVIRYVVRPEEEGKMVREVLNRLELSRRLLRKILSASGLSVNERPAYLGERVKAGDLIICAAEVTESEDILPEDIPIEILFEDADLLVVSKPAGMVVHPTHGHYTGTLANGVMYHWQKQNEQVRFRPLHRIDQDTSGLLAIAKSHFASQKMSRNLKKYLPRREYLAIVEGYFPSPMCTIDAPIGRRADQPHLRAVLPDGKQAVTHAASENSCLTASLVRLRLETGRTHQIRVHMAYIGHPLIGDKFYGHEDSKISRHALHAATLNVIHPRTEEVLEFSKSMPEDMQDLWEQEFRLNQANKTVK